VKKTEKLGVFLTDRRIQKARKKLERKHNTGRSAVQQEKWAYLGLKVDIKNRG